MTEFSFDAPLEWRVYGSAAMLDGLIRGVAHTLSLRGTSYNIEKRTVGGGAEAMIVKLDASGIGFIMVEDLPGGKARLRIPEGRGNPQNPTAWASDTDGKLFSALLAAILDELGRTGFLAESSRFGAALDLEAARREAGAADGPTGYAGVGNVCRGALIALANELYAPHMVSSDDDEPKGDDAKAKLAAVLGYYFAGRSSDIRAAIRKLIASAWELSVTLLHKTGDATREEAIICVAVVSATFDAFAEVVPRRP